MNWTLADIAYMVGSMCFALGTFLNVRGGG